MLTSTERASASADTPLPVAAGPSSTAKSAAQIMPAPKAEAPESVPAAPTETRKERLRREARAAEMEKAQAELAKLKPAAPKSRHRIILLTFLLLVLLPISASAWYLWNRAADQYASHVGFLVRSEKSGGALDVLGGLAELAKNSSSDTDILYKYIQSQALIEEVDKAVNLREIWSRHPEDFIFNYSGGAQIEDLHSHWRRMVKIYYDQGMLDLRVNAYTPEDAKRIADTIMEQSQSTINQINTVARKDNMRYAQEDLDRAIERLKTARQAVSNFRSNYQIIDPKTDVVGQSGILVTLQERLAEALVQLGIARANTTDKDPRIEQAELRVKVIREQIEEQRNKVSSSSGENSGLSDVVSSYEALEVDREFAETAYVAALAAHERARAEADRQALYLAAYVKPTLAQTAEYPKRIRLLTVISGFIVIAWLIGVLAYYGARDRR